MNFTLRPYQITGAKALAASTRNMLADPPGAGKTLTAIQGAVIAGCKRIVVVCPAIAKGVWKHEIAKWGTQGTWHVHVVNSYDSFPPWKEFSAKHKNLLVIVNYDLFSRAAPGMAKIGASAVRAWLSCFPVWDLLIADESHYLKNTDAKRTRELMAFAIVFKRVWWLTGTPAMSHYGEFYTMLRTLYPEAIMVKDQFNPRPRPMRREEFEEEYCTFKTIRVNGRQRQVISGSRNGDKLAKLLKGKMIRRKREDILKDLPPLSFGLLPLPVSPEAEKELRQLVAAYANASLQGTDALAALEAHIKAHPTKHRMAGVYRAIAVLPWITDLMEQSANGKLVIFARHHDVIDKLMELCRQWNPLKLDGRDSMKDRDARIELFQDAKDNHRIIVCNIQAAGTAITLTAAHMVLFVEQSGVPSENWQAALRCHRIGQPNSVCVYHACLDIPGDIALHDTLIRRERELSEVFDEI
jgi:SWI/SNF-related matrix-associated actin-dependent regulator of chromatin subfamily A-like protein 1